MTDNVTHTDLAVRLLRDAAGFFRNVADQNPSLADEMRENADVYEQVAVLLSSDPNGTLELVEDESGD